MAKSIYDVVIIGGGPAGLSAGLVLARSRRKIIIIDAGRQRNIRSHGLHGYLTRDGILPKEFLSLAREELLNYRGKLMKDTVTDVNPQDGLFISSTSKGRTIYSKKVLIATGIKDNLPPLPGIDEMYGKSVFHCPYCDGWESRDKRIALYANGKAAYSLSLSLKTWSTYVFICSDGPDKMKSGARSFLAGCGIKIFTTKIKKLRGENGILRAIEFTDGTYMEADALFFSSPHYQSSPLAEKLGCRMSRNGFVLFKKNQSTNIKGLFVAGDASQDIKFVIVAAAEGARAAVAINIELQEEEVERIKRILKVT